ncbi:MAG: hypothetical protein A2151_07565 [Candidatus Muproteobacteria bacterium RBG_16_65_34]|uniref:PilZ domain-containing protein n=1 Tax=Candidatus Muproteobacteria bacterium RBG_16_65_34 TaxID=1817760 RepID=A0A1F6TL47_9PROT|nr:MAG: hypothetical protein A2151_07565 [Candidatus Muproteobacteria bacterium RBG_16_65_34]
MGLTESQTAGRHGAEGVVATDFPAPERRRSEAHTVRVGHERRRGVRKILPLRGLVDCNGSQWPCAVRDCSLEGMFVQLREESVLQIGVRIEISLALLSCRETRIYRLHAHVVRMQAGGAALRLDRLDSRAYTAMVDTLYAN